MVLFEMVEGGKAYSKVQHDKRFTTGLMLELQINRCEPALISGSGLKTVF